MGRGIFKAVVSVLGSVGVFFGLQWLLPVEYQGWLPLVSAGFFVIVIMILPLRWFGRRKHPRLSRAPHPYAHAVGQVRVDHSLMLPPIKPPKAPYDELR